MKKYLKEEVVRDFLESVNMEMLKNDDLYKIRQLIMAEIFKEIISNDFNRYGEVLTLDINRENISNLYNNLPSSNKITDNMLAILNMPIIVTKYKDSTLISDLHEVSVVYKHLLEYGDLDNLQLSYGTVLCIKNKVVKVLNYKENSRFEDIISDTKYFFENKIKLSLEKILINHIKHKLYVFIENDEIKPLINEYSGPTYGFKTTLNQLDEAMSEVVHEMKKSHLDLSDYMLIKTRDFENDIASNVSRILLNYIIDQKLDINYVCNKMSIEDKGTIEWVNEHIIEIIKETSIRDIVKFHREKEFIAAHKNKVDLFIKAYEFNDEIDKIIEQIDSSVDKKAKTVLFSVSPIFGPSKVERRFKKYYTPIYKEGFKLYLYGIDAGSDTILDLKDLKEFTLSYRGKEFFHFTEDMAKRINTRLDEIIYMKVD